MQNLEYSFMVRELRQLEGKHFSKIYRMGENSFRIKIGDSHLIIDLPFRVGIAKYLPKGEEGSGFTEKLRKELDNRKLNSIYQCGKDRIIALEFDDSVLFLEMFAKGNIILTDKQGKIVEVLREERWKDRTLKKGETYKEPQSSVIEELEKTLSEKYAIVCLIKLPLGKEYAKEMLERCGIEERKPGNTLSKDEISCLKKEYAAIVAEQKPYLFLENGKPLDYGLVKFKKYETGNAKLETKEMPTLSEAMEEYYANAPKPKTGNTKLEKLRRRLEEQLAALEKLKIEEKEAKEKGDFIYANYQKIEELLEMAKKAGMNNLGAVFKDYKIWKIDKEKKEIELEL